MKAGAAPRLPLSHGRVTLPGFRGVGKNLRARPASQNRSLRSSMARSRIKAGGPTRGRLRVLKMGMGSGKILAKGRVKKPQRGKGRS